MTMIDGDSLLIIRESLITAQQELEKATIEATTPELEEVKNHITQALDALRREGHDGRWAE